MIKTERLPKEYVEVDYIESSGTECINTDVTNNCYKSETLIAWKSLTTATSTRQLMGSEFVGYWGINNGKYELYQLSDYSAEIGRWDKVVFQVTKDSTYSYRYLTVNDNVLFNGQTSTTMPARKIFLFALNYNFGCNCRIKYQKIWNENNTLVRNFIPCYRKSDNEVGMYDLVNGVFYTNSGTGSFTYGDDI